MREYVFNDCLTFKSHLISSAVLISSNILSLTQHDLKIHQCHTQCLYSFPQGPFNEINSSTLSNMHEQ